MDPDPFKSISYSTDSLMPNAEERRKILDEITMFFAKRRLREKDGWTQYIERDKKRLFTNE